ncbi:MAG: IS982 family transposase, partial [Moheibacter sp.]
MNNLRASYNKILRTIKEIEPRENYLTQVRKPKMKDIEVVSLVLTAEYLGIDSEYELFRKLPKSLSSLIERSVYNKRKRKLFAFTEIIRSK